MSLGLSSDSRKSLTDEQIVAMLQNSRDRDSAGDLYQELFGRHYQRVAAWCFRFTGEKEAAADLAQGVFMKAYGRLQGFRAESKFSTWLYIIARNHCFTEARKWSTEPSVRGEIVPLHLSDARSNRAYRAVEDRQDMNLMWQLIENFLNETEARVITLHYCRELPLDVVTRQLALTNPSGAKAYIVSARRKLTAAFQASQQRQLATA
jgi:RNA polymerase sigma-70 factor (ECF subfamily)